MIWCCYHGIATTLSPKRAADDNINRIGPEKRINGKSGKAETTIFWPYYSEKCRAVGAYSPRRNRGRDTASRQTVKTVDTRH